MRAEPLGDTRGGVTPAKHVVEKRGGRRMLGFGKSGKRRGIMGAMNVRHDATEVLVLKLGHDY